MHRAEETKFASDRGVSSSCPAHTIKKIILEDTEKSLKGVYKTRPPPLVQALTETARGGSSGEVGAVQRRWLWRRGVGHPTQRWQGGAYPRPSDGGSTTVEWRCGRGSMAKGGGGATTTSRRRRLRGLDGPVMGLTSFFLYFFYPINGGGYHTTSNYLSST